MVGVGAIRLEGVGVEGFWGWGVANIWVLGWRRVVEKFEKGRSRSWKRVGMDGRKG